MTTIDVLKAAPELRTYSGKHGDPAASDLLLSQARSHDYRGLLIPGGFMPDMLRRNPKALARIDTFHEQGKLVAFICHGGWIPNSARILKAKCATGS